MNPIHRLLNWYFSKESLPYWCVLLADTVVVFLSALFTYWVFHKTQFLFTHRFEVLYTAIFYSFLSWCGAKLFSTYSGVVRYSSFVDLMRVAYANVLTMVLALVLLNIFESIGFRALSALTVTETVLTFIIATLLMWGVRVIIKTLHDLSQQSSQAMRVLIYGALSGGIGLAKNIRSQNPLRFRLCGFISHDKRAKHMLLMGEKVYNLEEDDIAGVIERQKIQGVLVSPLRLEDFRNNQQIQDLLINAGVKIFMTRQVEEANFKDGELSEKFFENVQLREVSVEDLLPRSEIKIDLQSVCDELKGKRVLITGSAGSIGSEIVRQIASFGPEKMMLIDQAETPEHDIRLMMQKRFPHVASETIVTSICKPERMEELFSRFRPDYVFHAAAYKHVPMMEDNPSEAVQNNIYGTKVIADLSVKYGVKKFVMVSTDKAVNPTNVMGCSKRICEIYVQSLDKAVREKKVPSSLLLPTSQPSALDTQFVTTRFGNVLGSNGSVIPLFREQIKNGGPVTVTDPNIVRFFMLIPEACKLVLEAGTKGNGGEILVFDMGQPVKIADLARRMIMLSGATNVEVKFTGLRAGEKLYEEVLNELEGTKPSFHEKIRIAEVRQYDYDAVCKDINDLIEISRHYDNMATVKKMKEIVPEYKSNNSVYEQLDKK
ncbi:MAG: polysaccharide biosynthesis protein [Prevotella sp.]|nr:polysaccharide biosynthesis protein [Prevotella sp.]